jgi:hypothetical protein
VCAAVVVDSITANTKSLSQSQLGFVDEDEFSSVHAGLKISSQLGELAEQGSADWAALVNDVAVADGDDAVHVNALMLLELTDDLVIRAEMNIAEHIAKHEKHFAQATGESGCVR